MIAQSAFTSYRERACGVLMSRGYDPVLPVESSYLSRYIPLHLVGIGKDDEVLCVKLRMAYGTANERYVESSCRFECCQFRSLLQKDPGDAVIHCEVWVVSTNKMIHCFEIFPNGIREVAAYAR